MTSSLAAFSKKAQSILLQGPRRNAKHRTAFGRMPRFYFRTRENGSVDRDGVGVECDDVATAITEAVRAIREAVADEAMEGQVPNIESSSMEILDENREPVARVTYAEAVYGPGDK